MSFENDLQNLDQEALKKMLLKLSQENARLKSDKEELQSKNTALQEEMNAQRAKVDTLNNEIVALNNEKDLTHQIFFEHISILKDSSETLWKKIGVLDELQTTDFIEYFSKYMENSLEWASKISHGLLKKNDKGTEQIPVTSASSDSATSDAENAVGELKKTAASLKAQANVLSSELSGVTSAAINDPVILALAENGDVTAQAVLETARSYQKLSEEKKKKKASRKAKSKHKFGECPAPVKEHGERKLHRFLSFLRHLRQPAQGAV